MRFPFSAPIYDHQDTKYTVYTRRHVVGQVVCHVKTFQVQKRADVVTD